MKTPIYTVFVILIIIVILGLFLMYFPSQKNIVETKSTLSNYYDSNYDSSDFALDQKILGDLELINSPYITEYELEKETWPLGIVVSKYGDVWIGGSKSNKLLSFEPSSENISYYDIPTHSISEPTTPKMIWTIVEDNDGLIWFSQTGKDPLWTFNKTNTTFELIDKVQSSAIQMEVSSLTGNIWFTDNDQDIVGVIQKNVYDSDSNFTISEFMLPEDSGPFGLYVDNEERIWITEPTNNVLYQYEAILNNNVISGISKIFELRQSNNIVFHTPSDVLVQDDKVWFTEHLTNYFLEYDISSDELKRYPTSINPRQYGTLPFWMKWDVSGQGFWFVEHFGNRISFFNTTDNSLTEYEIPTRDPAWGYVSNTVNISVDPTNPDKLWFSELYPDKIGVVDRSIKIPFDVHTSQQTIFVDNAQNEITIDFTVSTNDSNTLIKNNTLYIKKSSTIVASGGFGNVTAKFDANDIDIQNTATHDGKLHLSGIQNIPSGNYIVAISVTDGTVTKTIYTSLVVL